MTNKPQLVVVTGAGSGIGRATVLRFAEAGAIVIASDIDLETATVTANLVSEAGGTAHPVAVDVSDARAMEAFAADIQATYGVADVVVNNAGFTTAGSFLDHTTDDWTRLMGVNVYGVIHGCRLFAQQMVERGEGGQIINVASAAAYLPIPLSSPYCATKTAVLMLSQCLRIELAREGIGVTAICPGFIDTGFYSSAQMLGMDDAEVQKLRDVSVNAAHGIGSDADVVARAIVKASRSNPAIRPVTREAWLGFAAARLSPSAVRFFSRYAVMDRARGMVDKGLPARVQNYLTAGANR